MNLNEKKKTTSVEQKVLQDSSLVQLRRRKPGTETESDSRLTAHSTVTGTMYRFQGY